MTAREKDRPVAWRAEWIWHGDDPAPFHFHLFLRRTFRLPAVPGRAVLHVTASDRYRLSVNGRYLGRGPERCDQRFQSYDDHDLTDLLRTGDNTIAVDAYFYGCMSAFARDGRAGFLAQLDADGAYLLGTDESWKARPARGWRRDTKQVAIGVGLTEILDTRLDPPDWREPGHDDAAWDHASIVPLATGQWCSRPEPRHIPFLEERAIRAAAVLRVGETLELDDTLTTVDVPEMMAREIHEELVHATLTGTAALAEAEGGGARPRAAQPLTAQAASSPHAYRDDTFDGIRDPFVLLDFGRQVNAYPRLVVEGTPGDIVDIAYGEQLIGGRIAPILTSTRCADRFILRGGRQEIQVYEYKSFRYLQLAFRTHAAPVTIHEAGAVTWRYPAEVRGAFRASDDILSRIWNATVATTDLCTDDAFMDSPLREKRNWLGDGSHILLGVWAAWGNPSIVRRYFQLVQQGPFGDGMVRMFFPGSDFTDPKTKIAMAIPQHALVWASRVLEHYRLFGDQELLARLYPTLRELDSWCLRHVNTDGLLDRLPYFNWLDWTPVDIRGANLGTNAFWLHMVDDMVTISSLLGLPSDAGHWRARSAELRRAAAAAFWDEARGVFSDSLFRGARTGIASEIGNAAALLFDILPAGDPRRERVVHALCSDDRSLAPATPLFFHYVPQALFRDGRGHEALRMIRSRFRRMMAESGTIWEGWGRHAMLPHVTETSGVPDVVRGGRIETAVPWHRPCAISLAHCGGLGTGFLLLSEVLGIQPRGPGFDGCVVRPRIDLLESADGAFPAPQGVVKAGWHREGGSTRVFVETPSGLAGEIVVPGGSHALAPGRRTEVVVLTPVA